jgi:hypothetical protein
MTGHLDEFCQMIKARYGNPANVAPGDLAKDIVVHSGLSSYPSFLELHNILKQYGVGEITAADLRAGKLKGHHFSYKKEKYTVLFEKGLWMGSIEHVMLHELYEISLNAVKTGVTAIKYYLPHRSAYQLTDLLPQH